MEEHLLQLQMLDSAGAEIVNKKQTLIVNIKKQKNVLLDRPWVNLMYVKRAAATIVFSRTNDTGLG